MEFEPTENDKRRAEILAAIAEAEESFARGEGRTIKSREEALAFAQEIKQRGLARLNATSDTSTRSE